VYKKDRKFGLELEFDCEYKEFKDITTDAIGQVYGDGFYYCRDDKFESTFKLDKWHIKVENSSVSELTTPVSTLSDLPNIMKVLRILKRKGIHGDKEDCGCHVHIDIPDIDKYEWCIFWMIYEKAIISCFPKERRGNTFCGKIVHKSDVRKRIPSLLEHCVAADKEVFSLYKYDRRRTVEVRICETTTDTNFLTAWVKFLVSYCHFIIKQNPYLACGDNCCSVSTEDMLEKMTLDGKSKAIMMNRYNQYKKIKYW
jgi:hypothetical protein